MKYMTWVFVDKSGWARGPWDDEPDKVQWPDEATGLPCLIHRGPHGGLCGYVGVPAGHPWHGKGYEHIDADVHGGLTFADRCGPTREDGKGICHTVEPGEDDAVWWVGFDCAHAFDLSPGTDALLGRHGVRFERSDLQDVYRTLDYVREECRKLAWAAFSESQKVLPATDS